WKGKRVLLRLAADVGTSDNSTGDWAAWSNPRLETPFPILTHRIGSAEEQPAQIPGPHGVSDTQLQTVFSSSGKHITKAVLHFQAIGVEGPPSYPISVTLNGRPAGTLPPVHGDESVGRWDDGELVLPTEVLTALRRWNAVEFSNPAGDSYKVRNVWLECETTLGTISSWITRTMQSQPPSWRYAAGERVAEGMPIRYDLLFAPTPDATPVE
ncbi:MAG: hypothetical protein D6741_10885, partial [Planctomycetota bacterium]